jgi:ABC-type multidrug transport system ATPase subunit
MLIDANHLQLTLERRTILKDVSLHLERGEIYGLLGPNGAGKSTTIAILLGLHTPRAGRLSLFDGEDSDPRKMRLRIGVMPELESLYLRLTTPGEAVGLEAAP